MKINGRGLWWLPEQTCKKISGHFVYKDTNEAELVLSGTFDEKAEFHAIILGEIEGCKFTLVNCARTLLEKARSQGIETITMKFKVVLIFKGYHYLKKEDLRFSKVSVGYSHLRNWLGAVISGNKKYDPYLKQSTEKSFTVNILNEFSIEINGFLERGTNFYYNYYNKQAKVIFRINNLDFISLIKTITVFGNFLGICIDEKIKIYSIQAQEAYGIVDIIYPRLLKPNSKNEHEFSIPSPIEFNLFLKNAKLYLDNWYSFTRNHEPTYELFFSDEQSFITSRFLSYCQAIEAYHSRKYQSNYFPDSLRQILDEFTNFKETIKLMFPNQISSAILEKFRYINRKSLRMVFKDLLKGNDALNPIFINGTDAFINFCVNTRNYYTHYDPSSTQPDIEKVVHLTDDCRIVLLCVFLKELGMAEQNMKSAVYRYCRKRVRGIWVL